jgi:putative ABC transport system permease protein
MLRHLMQMLWRRRSRHLLLTLEVSLAFIVVFAVSAFALYHAALYRLPLGYDIERVWQVQLLPPRMQEVAADPAVLDRLRRHVQALSAVEAVANLSHTPYANARNTTTFRREDGTRSTVSNVLSVSDGFFDTLRLQRLQGRWFGPADGGTDVTPAVVNRRLAQTLFPDRPAVGEIIVQGAPGESGGERLRITGVVDDYRDEGEFMAPPAMVLTRFSARPGRHLPMQMAVKVRAGTPRAFEVELLSALRQVHGGWDYPIHPLADLRVDKLRQVTVPLTVMSIVAGFLLLMVAFGLLGVLWQSMQQRTAEIGLRRAVGATASQIRTQVLAEQALLSAAAAVLALLLLVQLPLTGALGEAMGAALFAQAAAVSTAVIIVLNVLCALVPAHLASRLNPAQALHHE